MSDNSSSGILNSHCLVLSDLFHEVCTPVGFEINLDLNAFLHLN